MEEKTPYQPDQFSMFPSGTGCPFYNRHQTECRAAAQLHEPNNRYIVSYCSSEDYDDCPLFLCRALRSSEIKGRMHDPELLSGK